MKSVISGGMYVGNDTSHERQSDFFERNRGLSFVQPFSNKWRSHLFDSFSGDRPGGPRLIILRRMLLLGWSGGG